MTTTTDTSTCPQCGSFVADQLRHTEWHHKLEAIEQDADEALEIAKSAANILYRHGIRT